MANIALGDHMLLTYKGELAGQTTLTQFNYRITTVSGSLDVADACQSLITEAGDTDSLEDAFLACCPLNFLLREVWAQVIAPIRYAKVVTTPVGKVGSWNATAVTANVAGVITKKSELAGRRYIGSTHVPIAPDPTAVAQGQLQPGLVVVMEALASEMLATFTLGFDVATAKPEIYHRVEPDQSVFLTATQVQTTSRVMRRRTVGLGI